MILLEDYVCAVPAVLIEDGYYLKTAYKSRKLNKRFGRVGPNVHEDQRADPTINTESVGFSRPAPKEK